MPRPPQENDRARSFCSPSDPRLRVCVCFAAALLFSTYHPSASVTAMASTAASSAPAASGTVSDPTAALLLNMLLSSCLSDLGAGNSIQSPRLYAFVNEALKSAPVAISLRDGQSIVVSGSDALSISSVCVRRESAFPTRMHLTATLDAHTVTLHLSVPPAHPTLVIGFRGTLQIDLDCSRFPVLQAHARLDPASAEWDVSFGTKHADDFLHKAAAAIGNALLQVDEHLADVRGMVTGAITQEMAKVQSFDVDLLPSKDTDKAQQHASHSTVHAPTCTCTCAKK